jgi:hypothetical protein
MLKSTFLALIGAFAVFVLGMNSVNAGSFTDSLIRDMNGVTKRIQTWCDANKEALDWSGTAAPPDDPRALLNACAERLDGRPWPHRDPWVFHGVTDTSPRDGEITTIGFRREVELLGKRFLFVVGHSWRTQYPDTDRQRVSTLPVADLYMWRDGQWTIAWHYLTTDGKAHRPNGPLNSPDPDFDATAAVDKGWTTLYLDYQGKAHSFLDSRGSTF